MPHTFESTMNWYIVKPKSRAVHEVQKFIDEQLADRDWLDKNNKATSISPRWEIEFCCYLDDEERLTLHRNYVFAGWPHVGLTRHEGEDEDDDDTYILILDAAQRPHFIKDAE